jgi:phosphoglycerate dehydrogenase-like enzyme
MVQQSDGSAIRWFSNPIVQQSDANNPHLSLSPETREMINARSLAVNETRRHPPRHAARSVESTRAILPTRLTIAGAPLDVLFDVLSMEPAPAENPLLAARNCLIPTWACAAKERATA